MQVPMLNKILNKCIGFRSGWFYLFEFMNSFTTREQNTFDVVDLLPDIAQQIEYLIGYNSH